MTEFVSCIINIITGFFGDSGFYSSILLAPFVFWTIRQVFVIFHMIFGAFTRLEKFKDD